MLWWVPPTLCWYRTSCVACIVVTPAVGYCCSIVMEQAPGAVGSCYSLAECMVTVSHCWGCLPACPGGIVLLVSYPCHHLLDQNMLIVVFLYDVCSLYYKTPSCLSVIMYPLSPGPNGTSR